MAIGTLYVSHSTKADTEKFHSIPFHSASIDWKREEASTMSFTSPVKLEQADRVRYEGRNSFGGQIYKMKHGMGDDYQYEVISYLRLYHDKVSCSFKNKTSSQILKKVLKMSPNNFRTSGIKNTTAIHSKLKWENTSIWNIALQLAWLEHQAGFEVRVEVDADGTLIFKYADEQQKGYSFTNVFDYSEEYDSSDLITASRVTYNGQTLANATASNSLIAKWGYVSEVEECQSTSGSSGANTTSNTQSNGKLKNTANIQKYNIPSKVVQQALTIAKEGNSQYKNLKLLFDWVNNHVTYTFYLNTRRGALKTLNDRKGNCCDNAHLMIAMARSIGIKSRYCHSKGKYGHVFGEYYVDNKWFICDTGTKTGYWGKYWPQGGKIISRTETINF